MIAFRDRAELWLNVDGGKDPRGTPIVTTKFVRNVACHVGYLSSKMSVTTGWPITQLIVTSEVIDGYTAAPTVLKPGYFLKWQGKTLLAAGDPLIRSINARPHHQQLPVKLA